MPAKKIGLIGLSAVILAVIVINVFSYNQNPKVKQISQNNNLSLLIDGQGVVGCKLVNYIEKDQGGDLVFNCPGSDLIDNKSVNADMLINSVVSQNSCEDDVAEYNSTHVFKCYIQSLKVLNGF
jgi:hypothetical protein